MKQGRRVLCLSTLVALMTGCGVAPGPVDADATEAFTTTASGLKYRIRRASDRQRPGMADMVRVHYRGWLDDGTEFDSSYGRGQWTTFALTSVIPAWAEGLQLVGEGGMIELEVPPELGYGKAGSPPTIPPNSTLHFLVEVLEIIQSEG